MYNFLFQFSKRLQILAFFLSEAFKQQTYRLTFHFAVLFCRQTEERQRNCDQNLLIQAHGGSLSPMLSLTSLMSVSKKAFENARNYTNVYF